MAIKLYKELPHDVAVAAYRWQLYIDKADSSDKAKSKISKVASKHGKEVLALWKSIADRTNNIDQENHSSRLFRALLTYLISDCGWCLYYMDGICIKPECKYRHSLENAASSFGVSSEELTFVYEQVLTEDDKERLATYVETNVNILVRMDDEEYEFKEIYIGVVNELEGNLKNQLKVGANLKSYGIMPKDLLQDLFARIWDVIRRYNHMHTDKISQIANVAIQNRVRDLYDQKKAHNTPFESYVDVYEEEKVFGLRYAEDYAIDHPTESSNPEDEYIKKESRYLKRKIIDIREKLDGIPKIVSGILMGETNKDFTKLLKKKGILKKRQRYSRLYNECDPVELVELLKDYLKYDPIDLVKESIIECASRKDKGAISTILIPNIEERKKVMEKLDGKIKVSMPKTTCIHCAYWIDSYASDPTFFPKDCDPTFPGCPVHIYKVVEEFPIESAALQWRLYYENGDDENLRKFMASAPNYSQIIKAGLEIPEDVILETMESRKKENKVINLRGKDKSELVLWAATRGLDVSSLEDNLKHMTEAEVRDTVVELYNDYREKREQENESWDQKGPEVYSDITRVEEEDDATDDSNDDSTVINEYRITER